VSALAAIPCTSLLLATLLGVPSLAMGLLAIRLTPQAVVEPELYAVAEEIPVHTAGHRSLVLTDCDTGSVLPGLRGLRVFAGHFSLTKDFESKQRQLQRAGFDVTDLPTNANQIRAELDTLLSAVTPDYALVDVRSLAAASELKARGWTTARTNARWLCLRAPSSP
jgi:hypothetical protein